MEKVAARRVRVAGFTAVRRAPTVRIEAFKRRMKRLSVWGRSLPQAPQQRLSHASQSH
jgi:hypothetical protein